MKYLSNLIAAISLLFISVFASSFLGKQNYTDSNTSEKKDTIASPTVSEKPKTILEIADSICSEAGVPYSLVYEIGKNESNWYTIIIIQYMRWFRPKQITANFCMG